MLVACVARQFVYEAGDGPGGLSSSEGDCDLV